MLSLCLFLEWFILKEDLSLDAIDAGEGEFPGALLFSLRVGLSKDVPRMPHSDSRPLLAYDDTISTSPSLTSLNAPNEEKKVHFKKNRRKKKKEKNLFLLFCCCLFCCCLFFDF